MAIQTSKTNFYIGLMSGTSMDSVDAALVEIKKNKIKLIETHSSPLDETLRDELMKLCSPGENGINRMGEADVKMGLLFSDSVKALLKKSNLTAKDIVSIGSHGQTIRHMPNATHPFTLQIGDPNLIAAKTGITTVGDFRRRDIALGGQGAPLAPAFHQFLFQRFDKPQCILNIGGFANVTLINPSEPLLGFDTGPGNSLIDAWIKESLNLPFDNNGEWAQVGTVNAPLLLRMLDDPYFSQPIPKSTGREYFNLNWVKQLINEPIVPKDLQATLTELTARSIAKHIDPDTIEHLWVCGGGHKNRYLMDRLQALCPLNMLSTAAIGIPPDWMEACAFAWLAHQTIHRQAGNIPSVTGAEDESLLGAIYL